MNFIEIETKYKAEDIKLEDFSKLMESMNPERVLKISSFDYYYVSKTSEDCFIRYRAGQFPELTAKQKIKDTNNYIRVECNLKLNNSDSEQAQKNTVDKFCNMINFDPNFTIYKSCFIYFWGDYNIVYYVVYDMYLNEQRRFIEIEINEDKGYDETIAWNRLSDIETSLLPLGIKANKRVKLSLFEMFKK